MSDRWEEALRRTPGLTVTPAAASMSSVVPLVAPEAVEREEYQPWGREHTNIDDVIEVRRKTGEWRQVFRNYLVGVEGVGDTTLSLLGSSYIITLTGRHLGELRRLIKARSVDFIQEFDPQRWAEPAHGLPRVDQIEILQARAGRSLPEGPPRR